MKLKISTSLAALSVALTSPVAAQIDTITVTAQKREENVQDVPISISAFTAEGLRERQVTDVAALANIAPNVSLDGGTPFSGSTAVLSAFIRGIGQNDFAMNLDPGVGVYLDGVYLARTVGANLDLPDVERIEILKGPQGTLFGRNSIGGAISVITHDPGDEFSFKGDVTTGRFNRLDVRGIVDLPISEGLAASITFSSKHRDGYQKRAPYPGSGAFAVDAPTALRQTGYETSEREGGIGEWTLRGKVLWEPTDRFTARISGDYLHIDQSSMASSLLGTTEFIPGPFGGEAANNIPGTAFDPTETTGFLFAGLYNYCIGATPGEIASRGAGNLCGPRGTALNPAEIIGGLGSVNVDGDPGNDRLPYDARWISNDIDTSWATGNSFSKMKSWGITSILDYELNDNLNLKSITGYRDMFWRSGLDVDHSPVAMLEPSFSLDQWQFSQEVQLTGSYLDETLNFVLGGYYFKEKGYMEDYVTFAAGLLQIFGPNDLKTSNYAFFGNVDWRLTDFIGITAGARYTNEDKEFEGGQTDLNGFNYKLFNCLPIDATCAGIVGFPNPGEPLRYFIAEVQERSFDNFSPRVSVQLYPTDDVMVYGSWSRGYKTGGWTTRLSNPLPTAPSFDEEEAETFEVGFKSTLLDRRLQLNAAAYTTEYDGIQLNFQQGVSPTIQNAGVARIKGFEVEAIVAPVPAFTINASIGYTDSKFTDVLPESVVMPNPFQAGIFVGSDVAKTPEFKANISPRYEANLGAHGSLIFLADYTHTSSMWNDTERTYLLSRPKVDMLNIAVTYRPSNEAWDLTIGATNLLDERYIITGQAQIAGGQIYGTYSRPQEWYAKLGFNF